MRRRATSARGSPGRLVWLVTAIIGALLLSPAPASAAFDLFARHEVTVQFATPEGKPLPGVEVSVFAPGGTPRPDLAGRADANGRFEFPADQDGFWIAEAKSGKEVVRVMIRVGDAVHADKPLSVYWLYGALVLLLVLAFSFRIMRARARRPRQ